MTIPFKAQSVTPALTQAALPKPMTPGLPALTTISRIGLGIF